MGNSKAKLGKAVRTIRDELMAEFEQEAYANRPETADHYTIPEGVDESLAVDNPLFRWWANHAFENGYSQEEFDDGIAVCTSHYGDRARPMMQSERTLAKMHLPGLMQQTLGQTASSQKSLHGAFLMMGQTAVGIKALEYMQSQTKQSAMNGTAEVAPQITIEDVRTMRLIRAIMILYGGTELLSQKLMKPTLYSHPDILYQDDQKEIVRATSEHAAYLQHHMRDEDV